MRPCEGLSPTKPLHDAGILIDPPPSLAWAIGTMPAATAAAAPPLDPPGVRSVSHGLRVGPCAIGSVTGKLPSSGLLVRPRLIRPASRSRLTKVMSCTARGGLAASAALPLVIGIPASGAQRSFNRNGTPRNGGRSPLPRPAGAVPAPVASIASACSRARSYQCNTTALMAPSVRSMRSIAASTNSRDDNSPAATRAACAVASSHWVSSAMFFILR